MGQSGDSKGTSYYIRGGVRGHFGVITDITADGGDSANLEECDRGAVAHTEQEEADEDGDGRPEPIQLPVLGRSTGLVQFQLWTEKAVSLFPNKGWGNSLCGR